MTVRLKPRLAIQIKMRAEEQGITCSEYLRALAENELNSGGMADSLAQLNTEVTLVTWMMARQLLTSAVGKQEAKSIEDWANRTSDEIVPGDPSGKKWGGKQRLTWAHNGAPCPCQVD